MEGTHIGAPSTAFLTLFPYRRLVAAAAAALAQLKGCALSGGAVGGGLVAAPHLDLVERAVVLVAAVMRAAGHGAFDTGIDIPTHIGIPPLWVWH